MSGKHLVCLNVSYQPVDVIEFTRCMRPDGSHYGTAGQCRKGREVASGTGIDKKKPKFDLAAKLQNSKLTSANLIGDGAYAKVYDIGDGVLIKVGEIPESERNIMQDLKSIPNVPRVLAYGKSKTQEGRSIMAMTRVPGKPAKEFSASQQKKIFDKAYPLIRELHKRGISHNDLHNENILFDSKSGKISLIDFGLADKGHSFGMINDLIDLAQNSSGRMSDRVMASLERNGLFGDEDPMEMGDSVVKKKIKRVWSDIS